MSGPMKTYRVYHYDSAHKILTADWLDAESDEQAIARAAANGFGTQCELWDGRRLVAELPQEERTSA